MHKFHLILPDIRSCHNVGAMFRTADAFGVDMIYLVGYTPAPPKVQIDKVSLGAEKWVPFKQVKDLKILVKGLKKAGVQIIALEKSEESIDIAKCKFKKPVALIVGNEVDGIEGKILELCDSVVHVPMYGRKESLNVSVAAGIAMYMMCENTNITKGTKKVHNCIKKIC
ncbi:TrmH family RNA methyltransferase [Patescibacteria group bacterium]|nr:TrmH family RNA methyltransferase [Patescibacteria group bacterium]MBU1895268.1 TrmH family RNA methyltransferase [Patescibacteria group bacterium]